jgi:hypothetical protein
MYLKKGTVVKHGTSLDRLEEILRHGLKAGAKRNEIREAQELQPIVRGVYVANNLSY